MVVLAREGGADYVYSIITGYAGAAHRIGGQRQPALQPLQWGGDLSAYWTGQGPAPEGGFIAMPPPLTEANKVTFDDGTASTIEQEAKDVSAFLAWAVLFEDGRAQAERVSAVMIFLVIFAGLLFASYKAIWRAIRN